MQATVFFTPRTMGILLGVPKLLTFVPEFHNLELRSFALINGATYALSD